MYSQNLALEAAVNNICVKCGCVLRSIYPRPRTRMWDRSSEGIKHFEELSREDASFLHGSCLPHAERHWTPRVPEMKLPVRKINLPVITTASDRLQTLFWARKKTQNTIGVPQNLVSSLSRSLVKVSMHNSGISMVLNSKMPHFDLNLAVLLMMSALIALWAVQGYYS